jgi:glutamine synthetase type III
LHFAHCHPLSVPYSGGMKANLLRTVLAAVVLLLAILPSGCCLMDPVYYKTMAVFGREKRDLLASNVRKARDAQKDTQEVFRDALEQFSSVVHFDGGDLQKEYNRLSKELERCEGRASEVKSRIDAVEKVSNDLFKEWQQEIGQYQNETYRRDSEAKLRETRTDCERMLSAMRAAQQRIDPVLAVFRDQVLYLKHNLNARAIASLRGESAQVETDVARLVADLDAAIAEADSFISALGE